MSENTLYTFNDWSSAGYMILINTGYNFTEILSCISLEFRVSLRADSLPQQIIHFISDVSKLIIPYYFRLFFRIYKDPWTF